VAALAGAPAPASPDTDIDADTAALAADPSWRWFARYDAVVAVTTPYAPLDNTMRRLPPAPRLPRPPGARHQKRAAYLLGVDPHLLPAGGAPARFDHYELAWYRSPYELHLLEQLAGLQTDHFRMIHCFGVGEAPAAPISAPTAQGQEGAGAGGEEGLPAARGAVGTSMADVDALSWELAFLQGWSADMAKRTPDDADAAAANFTSKTVYFGGAAAAPARGVGADALGGGGPPVPILVVCFFHQRGLCGAAARARVVAQSGVVAAAAAAAAASAAGVGSEAAEAPALNYTLLLLGGTWAEWLVGLPLTGDGGGGGGGGGEGNDGGRGPPIVPYEQLPRTVHVAGGRVGAAMGLVRRAHAVFLMHPGHPTTTTIDGSLPGPAPGTVDDVLWPLVLAAQRGIHVHLAAANGHLVRSADDALHWTALKMQRTAASGVVRLHGFAPTSAMVRASLSLPRRSLSLVALSPSPAPACVRVPCSLAVPTAPPRAASFLHSSHAPLSLSITALPRRSLSLPSLTRP